MGHVGSLFNKLDELTALTRLQQKYKESSLMCFTETWLSDTTPDSVVALDGFKLVRADRGWKESGKRKGGGLADEYTSSPLPPLGRSDHNLVHLHPEYTPRVRRQPAQKKTVKLWTYEANERLRDCFETTDWDTLCSCHGDDINSLTHCITDYINFCVENTMPTKRVQCFANRKP
ncbi:hypothetical protein Q5P01_003154 [Channa striata]|uniref:Uncharacterized protein n=1 Tax=Channa striata TaxID=64152 RepID=A0AA88NU39_CHASR|nr:hypothetical protein Q5P01_003154 [Channa striata]